MAYETEKNQLRETLSQIEKQQQEIASEQQTSLLQRQQAEASQQSLLYPVKRPANLTRNQREPGSFPDICVERENKIAKRGDDLVRQILFHMKHNCVNVM